MRSELLAIPAWSSVSHPVIGMIHLQPLPGSPGYGGDLRAVREAARRDADALAGGGVHGLMIENFGDVPFYPGRVPAYVVAYMTAIAHDLRGRFLLPLGINEAAATTGKARWPSPTRRGRNLSA